MRISVYTMVVEMMVGPLQSLSKVLEKGAAYAEQKKFDPGVLLSARLAPDMFPLGKQVLVVRDLALETVARLTGRESPAKGNEETTFAGLRRQVQETIDALRKVDASAFEGAEERAVEIVIGSDVLFKMTGLEYLRDWALPNFFFHVVTAYDILRHNGVELGKADYLGQAGQYIRPRTGG